MRPRHGASSGWRSASAASVRPPGEYGSIAPRANRAARSGRPVGRRLPRQGSWRYLAVPATINRGHETSDRDFTCTVPPVGRTFWELNYGGGNGNLRGVEPRLLDIVSSDVKALILAQSRTVQIPKWKRRRGMAVLPPGPATGPVRESNPHPAGGGRGAKMVELMGLEPTTFAPSTGRCSDQLRYNSW